MLSAETARTLVLDDRRGAQHKTPVFRAHWGVRPVYGYDVGGERYTSDRVRPSVLPWKSELLGEETRTEAQGKLRSYPPGRTLTVTYDPRDPREAYLDIRTGAVLHATLALLLVWAALMAARHASRIPAPAGMPLAGTARQRSGREAAASVAVVLEYAASLVGVCVLLGVAAGAPEGVVARALHEETAFLLGVPALVVAGKVAAGLPRHLVRLLRRT